MLRSPDSPPGKQILQCIEECGELIHSLTDLISPHCETEDYETLYYCSKIMYRAARSMPEPLGISPSHLTKRELLSTLAALRVCLDDIEDILADDIGKVV